MAAKAQRTGMQGVFLVAAELAARGFVVSTTSRNAMGADLLVTDTACTRAYSVQVKTNAKPASFWLVGKKAMSLVSPSHVYVLVNLRKDGQREHFVVPSEKIAASTKVERRPRSTWHVVYRKDVEAFRDAWDRIKTEGERP